MFRKKPFSWHLGELNIMCTYVGNYLGIQKKIDKFKKTELITLASGAFRKSCKSLHLFGQ